MSMIREGIESSLQDPSGHHMAIHRFTSDVQSLSFVQTAPATHVVAPVLNERIWFIEVNIKNAARCSPSNATTLLVQLRLTQDRTR